MPHVILGYFDLCFQKIQIILTQRSCLLKTIKKFTFLLQEYKTLFEGAGNNPGEKTLEDKFFEYEVSIVDELNDDSWITCWGITDAIEYSIT